MLYPLSYGSADVAAYYHADFPSPIYRVKQKRLSEYTPTTSPFSGVQNSSLGSARDFRGFRVDPTTI